MSPALASVTKYFFSAGLLFIAINCAADNSETPADEAHPATVTSAANVDATADPAAPLDSMPASSTADSTGAEPAMPPTAESVQTNPPAATQTASSNNTPYFQGQAQGQQKSSPKIGSGAHLLNVTLGLMLIVGLIFGISWFVRRFGQGTFSANSHMKIIATMPLGARERIVLIDAGGQQLLLGITPTQVNTLHVFDEPITNAPGDASQSDFGRKLMAILQRPNAGESHYKNDEGSHKSSGNRE